MTQKTIELEITGMTCQSCEVLLERKLKAIEGVQKATVRHSAGTARIRANRDIPKEELQSVINDGHYQVASVNGDQIRADVAHKRLTPQEYVEIAVMALFVIGLYSFLSKNQIVPEFARIGDGMTLGVVFLVGIVASLSTCLAVTGGLVVAVTARHAQRHAAQSLEHRLKPQLFFNAGRIVGYAALGAVLGGVGSALALSPVMSGLISLLAGIAMVVLGTQILGIFPGLQRLKIPLPKGIAHKVHDLSESDSPWAPGLLGAGTFFLPCGFTQALQLFVLSNGGVLEGALIMGTFALGTAPVLFGLGVVSGFGSGGFRIYLLRIAGIVAVLFGVITVQSGLTLTGLSAALTSSVTSPAAQQGVLAPVEDGVQVLRMAIDGIDYVPHQFTVQKGVPVAWEIDATKAAGCMTSLLSRGLGINEYLGNGVRTIRFTPTKTGTFPFSCSMGMGTYGAAIIVIE